MSKNKQVKHEHVDSKCYMFMPGKTRGSNVQEPMRECQVVARGSYLIPGVEMVEVKGTVPFHWSAVCPITSLTPCS